MKRILTLSLAIAGLALSAPLLAQTTTTTTTDQYGNPTGTTGYGGTAGTTGYGGTGWDPSMVMAASGALAAGSFALKGVLRRKS